MATRLCTLSDVKAWLDITTTTYDTKLQLFIDRISAQMVAYLNFPVKRATYTDEVHPINNRQYLMLDNKPIQEVTACTIDGVTVTEGTADDSFQYTTSDAMNGMLYRGIGWCGRYYTRNMTYDPVGGARVILVTYVAGWYLPDDAEYDQGQFNSLPEAISSAAIEEVVRKYRKNISKSEGLTSFREGGMSWTWEGTKNVSLDGAGLSDDTIAVLNLYRRLAVA